METKPVFDTLKTAKDFQDAGAQEPLAEALVAAIGEAVENAVGNAIGEDVATKSDVELVRKDMELLRSQLTARIDSIGYRTLMITLGVLGPLIAAGFGYIGYMIQLMGGP